MFLSLFHWLVYICNPGTFNLIFNILFFFSVIFISPLTLFSHRSVTFLLHEVNSISRGSFIAFFPCSFYYIYVVNYDIFFFFILLGIRTIVTLWSRNKIDYYLIIIIIIILFVHVGKRSNSSSLMFFKIRVLKNFAIFSRKHLCRSFFLIKLQV